MSPRSEPNTRDTELALALILGVPAAVGLLIWCWAGIAGVLFGGGWPDQHLDTVARALARLPGDLANPRLAWPSSLRAGLPGPAGFYAALALTATSALAVAWLLTRLARTICADGDRPRRAGAGARWAAGGDLRTLQSSTLPARLGRRSGDRAGRRLALGYRGTRLLRAESRHALVVFGPPQSGKSAGIAIPSLLEWDGPAIASSIKTDLLHATIGRREQLGMVFVFDPFGLAPVKGATWTPIHQSKTWDGALSTAHRLTAAGELDTRTVTGGGFWQAAAEQRLAPLLWAAANTDAGIEAVVRWAYGQGDAELPAILHDLLQQASGWQQRGDAQAAYDAHTAFAALAGDTRSSVESTVQMLIRAYRSPQVQASAASCEITAERLLAAPNSLFLIGDPHRSKLLRPIFLALLQELIDDAYHQATIRGGRLTRPLLLCLDELGNIAPLPALAEVASTAPSHNIQLVSIFHDLAQARTRYGHQAETVINSHRARMLLPGVADLDTLRYFSSLLGEQETPERTDARRIRPRERRPLAPPEQLRQLGTDNALVIYGRLPPTILRQRLYFRDRKLRRLAETRT